MRTVAARRQDVPSRPCTKCKQVKPLGEFYRDPGGAGLYGHRSVCKACWNPSRIGKSASPEDTRRYRATLKQACVDAYGGRCACCGEARLIFLSIDHVHGDGAEHRKSIYGRNGGGTYQWFKSHGYPQDGRYQVLCHNCNRAKGTGTACPCRSYRNPPMPGQLALF